MKILLCVSPGASYEHKKDEVTTQRDFAHELELNQITAQLANLDDESFALLAKEGSVELKSK